MVAGTWRHLEQRVAQHFERNGYTARTNQVLRAPNGQPHEIDVLAEKRDVAGVHRVAVECKAWTSAVEKEVVYKLHQEMADLGLTKGIIVSLGGFKSGARAAAEQRHIELWGRDEIHHYLGEEALAGLPLALAEESLGVEVAVSRDVAEREVKKARSGFARIGTEEVVSIDLIWVPAFELQLAVTRLRPGLLNDKEEVVRRWVLFEGLTGRLIGSREEARQFATVMLDGVTLRPQRSSAQVLGDMRRVLSKHQKAKTEAAVKARQAAYNAVGLPGSAREFAVEVEKQVHVPFYVGLLRRKGSERFIAIHGGVGARTEAVEQALHSKVDVVHAALRPEPALSVPSSPGPPDGPTGQQPRDDEAVDLAAPPTCSCGAVMALRRRKSDNEAFWGCSTFPRCRHTKQIVR